ncbi:hypothetical protein KKR91_08100 [Arthrobacter jiangjiafuii]|uniref:WxL domain-containing protein n=2 Tax=Arthrobacter jiangjiafuii TaxID=2817475 RepID=A0A975R1N9_9MICC|nr:hypothetical protein [Arthrobacter jiangjiafuii]MBP3042965.1 hypothetical protein [Arthrobacter jiangjiafuii]QWC11492.1 hypothetical protein KKR91_08100 [Arthrobacter jiangjiafuii]
MEQVTDAIIQVEPGALGIDVGEPLATVELKPGEEATFALPKVTVTDTRAGTASWATHVSLTNFNTEVLDAKPITAAGATYTVTPDSLVPTGIIDDLTSADVTWTAEGEELQAVTAAGVEGNNTAIWAASLAVIVPDAALAGAYSATLTHSVL